MGRRPADEAAQFDDGPGVLTEGELPEKTADARLRIEGRRRPLRREPLRGFDPAEVGYRVRPAEISDELERLDVGDDVPVFEAVGLGHRYDVAVDEPAGQRDPDQPEPREEVVGQAHGFAGRRRRLRKSCSRRARRQPTIRERAV